PAPYVFPTAVPAAAPPSPEAPPASTAVPAAAVPASTSIPAPAPAPSGSRPEAHAAALGEGVVTIDGRADDAAWARAQPVSWDTDSAGAATPITTRARFLWSSKGLYALFELSAAGLHTDTSQPADVERKGLYNEDCVEIFLTPDPARPKRYFEIEL